MKAYEYQRLVNEQVRRLAENLGQAVTHHGDGVCPTCGGHGRFDLEGPGISAGSIYFSAVTGTWNCMVCELEAAFY